MFRLNGGRKQAKAKKTGSVECPTQSSGGAEDGRGGLQRGVGGGGCWLGEQGSRAAGAVPLTCGRGLCQQGGRRPGGAAPGPPFPALQLLSHSPKDSYFPAWISSISPPEPVFLHQAHLSYSEDKEESPFYSPQGRTSRSDATGPAFSPSGEPRRCRSHAQIRAERFPSARSQAGF